jgi:hypothetical protein
LFWWNLWGNLQKYWPEFRNDIGDGGSPSKFMGKFENNFKLFHKFNKFFLEIFKELSKKKWKKRTFYSPVLYSF